MNKRQKEVLQAQLNSEEEVIAQLKSTYGQALRDCEAKIQELSMRADLEPENIQSIIYQKQYQEAIKAQLEGALTNLQSDSYATVSDYLTRSYQDGYLGSMYDMQGQGIPLVMPVDQEAVTKAVMLDSKLSTSLYDRLGEDVKAIKKSVRQEVSRGIAQGMTWSNIASNLARNMKHTPFQRAYNNSIRIARTEGHRIQNRAALDAQKRAIDRGAEVVKQWNAVLDGRTRSEHRELDGQMREVGEMFEIAGNKAEAPGLFGDPSQDCNCRCCLDQRARWALNCGIVKMDNFSKQTVTFESPEEYAEWKKVYWSDENIAYMQHVTAMEKKYGKNFEKMLNCMTDKEYEKYKRLLDNNPMYKKKTVPTNKDGEVISFDWKGKSDKHKQQQQIISDLANEYRTRLQKVTVGAVKAAGDVNMPGTLMRLNSAFNEDAIHEFAHTLAGTNADKCGLTHNQDFWKEIKKVRSAYRKDVGDDTKRWISSYEHSEMKFPDEFFAEAFTQAKMVELGMELPSKYGTDLTYSKKVLEITDKYFKKTAIANSVENGTITLADINKMITPYERKVLDKIPAKSGYFDFAAHGSPDYIEYGEKGKNMSARDVARVISHNEKYNGQKVRMLSCSTGASDDGFAQQLANSLGVEVEAPTDVLYVYEDGHFKVGYDGSGTMKTFKPQGKR